MSVACNVFLFPCHFNSDLEESKRKLNISDKQKNHASLDVLKYAQLATT